MFNYCKSAYLKHKEIISYLFFGGLTTLVYYGVYYVFSWKIGFSAWLSGVFAWVAAVAFAYITNKIWVFESKKTDKKTVTRELISFIVARLISLGMSTVILFIFIDWFGYDTTIQEFIVLTAANIVVIIFNYFASKYFIFK